VEEELLAARLEGAMGALKNSILEEAEGVLTTCWMYAAQSPNSLMDEGFGRTSIWRKNYFYRDTLA
jgi:hypothetical protein